MTNPDLERLKSWFAAYASGFHTGDPEHDRVYGPGAPSPPGRAGGLTLVLRSYRC